MEVPTIRPGPRGFLEREGDEIYFECWGEGETVVLGHGMGGNHMVWYQQVPVLAERYRVVTWDQRGFGRSTNHTGKWGFESAVLDLRAILDHLAVERAHVVGQSMGGWAAMGLAIADPSRIRSVVLADTVGGVFTEDIRKALTEFDEESSKSPPPGEWALGFHPAVGQQLRGHDLARSFLYTQIGGMASPPEPSVVVEELKTTNLTVEAERLDLPVLLIVGENDPIFPPRLIDQAAALLQRATVARIPDAGHSPYFEEPDVWNRVVMDFLAGVA